MFDVPPDATPAPAPLPLPAPTPCGVLGDDCTGTCAPTAHGDLCFPACKTDDECRPKDGVFCDPQWHACMIPNRAAIAPAQCPATKSPARDPAFGASVAWSSDKPAGAYQNAPSAVLTADGGTTAVFTTRGKLGQTALQVVHVDGKGQRVDGVEPTKILRADEPHLARDRKGTLYAVWHGGDAETEQIGLATSSDGGVSWSTPVRVDDPADCPSNTSCLGGALVAVGGAHDTLFVAYGEGDAGLRVRASKDAGATWSAPVTALVGTTGNAAVGSDGTLHLVALNGNAHGAYGSAQQSIEYTVSSDGGATFKQPVTVSGRDELVPFYFARPAIAVDTRRKLVYVVYVRGGRDAVWDLVLATSKDGGVKWSHQVLAGGCAIHMVPTVALDDVTGNLHVAYYDNEGATGRFVHARCGAGGTKCQVLGAINSEPFAALSTGRETTTWLGESVALLVDSKRKKLHALWTQPVADPAIARIMGGDAPLK